MGPPKTPKAAVGPGEKIPKAARKEKGSVVLPCHLTFCMPEPDKNSFEPDLNQRPMDV